MAKLLWHADNFRLGVNALKSREWIYQKQHSYFSLFILSLLDKNVCLMELQLILTNPYNYFWTTKLFTLIAHKVLSQHSKATRVFLKRISLNSANSVNHCKFQQECIPVGCVPPACCPYFPPCTAPGRGVPAQGFTCLGVYLPGDVPAQGGVPARGYNCPGTPPLWT